MRSSVLVDSSDPDPSGSPSIHVSSRLNPHGPHTKGFPVEGWTKQKNTSRSIYSFDSAEGSLEINSGVRSADTHSIALCLCSVDLGCVLRESAIRLDSGAPMISGSGKRPRLQESSPQDELRSIPRLQAHRSAPTF